MKIIPNLLKDERDEWLVETTSIINNVNPIVDRIMENDSVEGVVLTNNEGAPIMTNLSLNTATRFGFSLSHLGSLCQNYLKELDPFNEVLVMRIQTKKEKELMLAPHSEFNIIVVQHSRRKTLETNKSKS